MPVPAAAYDSVDLTVANGGTSSTWAAIGNASELGLYVPTITSGTVTLQVAQDGSGTGASGLVDKSGTAILVLGASTGGFALSSNEMGACLGYSHLRVVCGAAQGAARTFKLTRKVVGVDPSV
jgi:hypothetical protein